MSYAPIARFVDSDHRGLCLEFCRVRLLGHNSDVFPKLAFRVVEMWHRHLDLNSAFSKQESLDQDTLTTTEVETLDGLVGQGCQSAESACRQRRPEWYSQPLVKTRTEVQLLRCQLRALLMGTTRVGSLTARAQSIGLTCPIPDNVDDARKALHAATTRLNRLRQNSGSHRRTELSDKASQDRQQGKAAKARILQKINKSETSRQTYRVLQAMKNRGGMVQRLDKLEIPASWPPAHVPAEQLTHLEDPKLTECTDWRTITDPLEIEYYLMLRNRLHFGQAQGTPFKVPPLSSDINWAATTSAAEDALAGCYTTTVSTAHCDHLLQACKAVTPLDSIPAELTLSEFQGKIVKWRETTTTSPSGRHLGCYKALFATSIYEESVDQDANQAFRAKQNAIAALLVSIINYAIRHQYVLHQWKSIVNTMIFKETAVYKIHRLRVIHIYEADFNLLLAVKWRRLLHHADREGLIHAGQYGGRPGCEAQSLTFLEELKYDITYLSRRTIFNFDNDAMSCYDRIIIALASIINRKYGQHRNIVAVHAKTLEDARYKLRTAKGISDLEYSHSSAFPLHGSGQGAGNSPCIWLFISSTLFDLHEQQAYGASFSSPDGTQQVRLTMVGFVDDSTGTCNDYQPMGECSLETLAERMQHDAQLWNDLLFCSGGRLELGKCSFHILHFQFKAHANHSVL